MIFCSDFSPLSSLRVDKMLTLHDWLHLAVIGTLDMLAFIANLILIVAILLR